MCLPLFCRVKVQPSPTVNLVTIRLAAMVILVIVTWSVYNYICTYVHGYIPAYVHIMCVACINAFIHAYVHKYMPTNIIY